MNQASMRKLAIEAALRTRIKRRIAMAARRDDCQCPLCVARRSGGGLIAVLRQMAEELPEDAAVTSPLPKSTPRH